MLRLLLVGLVTMLEDDVLGSMEARIRENLGPSESPAPVWFGLGQGEIFGFNYAFGRLLGFIDMFFLWWHGKKSRGPKACPPPAEFWF